MVLFNEVVREDIKEKVKCKQIPEEGRGTSHESILGKAELH